MKRPHSRRGKLSAIAMVMFTLLLSLWFVYERAASPLPSVARPTVKRPSFEAQSKEWQRWENCTLVPNRNNDGDSFVIQHAGQQSTVRLYFVDCPEKEIRGDNTQRLQDQARYFGLPTKREELQPIAALGKQAQSTVLAWLQANTFTVVTKGEQVYDSGRIYAHIFIGNTLLAETLIQQGLARIHTKGEDVPSVGKNHEVKNFLKEIEQTARKQGMGGWRR